MRNFEEIKLKHHLTYLGLVGYVFIGTAAVLIPSIMPLISTDYAAVGLTLTRISLIFPAMATGGIVGNLLSGLSSDSLGRTHLVWLSALLLSASLALSALVQPWFLFLIAFAFVSAAQGALSTSINAMIADAHRDARSRALNFLHGVYGMGATISPLVIGFALGTGIEWRWALAGTALIWLLYGGAAYGFNRRVRGEDHVRSPSKTRGTERNLSLLWQRPFVGLALIAFVYNGVAYSLLGWIALFMQEVANFSILASVSMISIFYVALTIGRFGCAVFSEKVGYARTLLLLALAITLTYPLVIVESHAAIMVIGVFCTGLGLSGLFPTALASGSKLFPEQTGFLTGTLNVAMTLGAMIPPLWTGILADWWSFQTALAVNYVMVPPLIIIALLLGQQERKRAALPKPSAGLVDAA